MLAKRVFLNPVDLHWKGQIGGTLVPSLWFHDE